SGQIAIQSVRSMYLSPLKLYEYMAMARPVVGSAYEDARRVIHEDQTGWLFKPDDPDDLARALRQAFEKRSRFAVIGQAARDLIVQQHSWDSRICTLIDQVQQVVHTKETTRP